MAQGTGRSDANPEARSGLTLIAPPRSMPILLLAAPLADDRHLQLSDRRLVGHRMEPCTLANYLEVWTDPIYRAIMLRSLMVSVSVTLGHGDAGLSGRLFRLVPRRAATRSRCGCS